MHINSSMKISSLLALFLLYMGISSFAASNMLMKNQEIRDGETLVSPGERFVLGFFSPPKSTNRYVGIWYNKVSIQTVVWVANRERPLIDSTGILTINDQGNLVIMEWRGGLTMIAYGSLSSNTSAELLENGNLVLMNGNGGILWQSFDYPTDTFLPEMKAGRNLETKQNFLLTSWASESDPTPGVYTFGIDPNGTTKIFIWQRGTLYWTSGGFAVRNRSRFSSSLSQFNSLFYYTFVSNEKEQYYTYSFYNKSIISRIKLLHSGQFQQTMWSEDVQTWKVLWTVPSDRCDVYAPCGPYGSCNSNTISLCECLQGFVPVSPRDWESSNWLDGCKRRTEITCGNEDAFLYFKTMRYPEHAEYVEGIGLIIEKCKSMCVNNCSCTAYASANVTACLFWSGDLVGLRKNWNGTDLSDGGDIFIRVSASDLGIL
ncbi:hypothetical protein ACHQM5_028187 [Ranunculus cassubicifolius]